MAKEDAFSQGKDHGDDMPDGESANRMKTIQSPPLSGADPEPEELTSPGFSVPPPEPPQFDIESSGAPEYLKQFWREQRKKAEEDEVFREEERRFRADQRATLQRLEKNQSVHMKDVRRLSRRVTDHDGELEDIRERLDEAESTIFKIRGQLDSLSRGGSQ